MTKPDLLSFFPTPKNVTNILSVTKYFYELSQFIYSLCQFLLNDVQYAPHLLKITCPSLFIFCEIFLFYFF